MVEYQDGLRLQEILAREVRARTIPQQLVLLRHPPVVTLGRHGDPSGVIVGPEVLAARGVELFRVDRGGQATYHDPGQLVGYPILEAGQIGGARGLVALVEEALAEVLDAIGVEARTREGLPGSWTDRGKVAALGMRLDRGVSRHGFALNLSTAPDAWGLIVPCGLRGEAMVSVRELTGSVPDHRDLVSRIGAAFASRLGLDLEVSGPDLSSVLVLIRRGNELLLLRRTQARGGFWQPVTGKVEHGETTEEAAVREILEETGLTGVRVRDLGYVHTFPMEPGIRDVDPPEPMFMEEHGFVASAAQGWEPRIDPREHDLARWVTPREAQELLRWRGDRRAVELLARRPWWLGHRAQG